MLEKLPYDPAFLAAEFDQFAAQYEGFAKANRYRAAHKVAAFVHGFNSVRSPVILDVGAGTGILTSLLRTSFAKATIHALDMSSESLEICRAKSAADTYIKGNILDDDLALPSGLDIVVSAGVFEYVPDLKKAIENATRNLKEDGLFMFTTFYKKRMNKEGRRRGLYPNNITIPDNIYPVDRNDIKRILVRSKMDVVKITNPFIAYKEPIGRDIYYNIFVARKKVSTPQI